MSKFTSEFKVGLFVVLITTLIGGAYLWSFDGVRKDEPSFTLRLAVDSADGVYVGTSVRIAGVEVGSVENVELESGKAVLVIRVRDQYELSEDTMGELKATGLLGDYIVRLYPGVDETPLQDGAFIATRSQPGDIDTITRNIERVSDDVAAITAVLREVVEDRKNTENLEATLANMAELTGELTQMVSQNRRDVDAIVDSVRRLTESLEVYSAEIAGDVDEEMEQLKDLTADLDGAAEDIASIVSKIDSGEGTLGALVNDSQTIDTLNETIEDVQFAVKSFTGLRPEVYYTGRFYYGSQPRDTDTFFYGNPLSGAFSNTVGVKLRAHEDFWYFFEVVSYPQGTVSRREVLHEELGTVETRWIREGNFRFTFMMEKRWGPASLRLGIREDGGGVGLSLYAWQDRFRFEVDVFDFEFGSYPAVQDSGIPNIRALARIEPFRNLYFEAGMEQIALGAKYGYATGFMGLGFHFTDDDVKWVLSGLPLNF